MLVHQRGFSLIEFLVYIAVLTGLIMCASQWAIAVHQSMLQHSSTTTHMLQLHAAHDVLVRELSRASIDLSTWKKIARTELIWRVADKDIGFLYEKNRLFRYEGSYNSVRNKWVASTKSLIADELVEMVFEKKPTKILFYLVKKSSVKKIVVDGIAFMRCGVVV